MRPSHHSSEERPQSPSNLNHQVRDTHSAHTCQDQKALVIDTVFSAIVDFAYAFNRSGRFTYANQALLKLMDVSLEDALDRSLVELGYPEDLAARLEAQVEHVFQTGHMVRDETPYTDDSGITRNYEYIFVPVYGPDGTIEAVAGSTRDIARRKKAEEAVRESEERLRIAVEGAELATWDWHLPTNDVRFNARYFKLLDIEPLDRPIRSGDFFDHVHPDDRVQLAARLERAIHERDVFEAEFRVIWKDGSIRWLRSYGSVVELMGDTVTRMSGVMLDITDRKHADARQQMLEHEITLWRERHRLGQELHDSLSQSLFAIRLQMDVAEELLATSPAYAIANVVRARDLAQESLHEVRRVVGGLRSARLEANGLASACAEMIRRVTEGTDVNVAWYPNGVAYALPAAVESELFRIAQEALTNAVRHAGVKEIEFTLTYAPTSVELRVADRGSGFNTDADRQGFGLTGMAERATRIGGEFRINSAPNTGTEVRVSVPAAVLRTREIPEIHQEGKLPERFR